MDLIQAGSRFLTDTESRYATIELEMVAVCWAEIDTNGHPEMTLTDIRTLHGNTTESLRLQDIWKHAEEDLSKLAVTQFHPTRIPYPPK